MSPQKTTQLRYQRQGPGVPAPPPSRNAVSPLPPATAPRATTGVSLAGNALVPERPIRFNTFQPLYPLPLLQRQTVQPARPVGPYAIPGHKPPPPESQALREARAAVRRGGRAGQIERAVFQGLTMNYQDEIDSKGVALTVDAQNWLAKRGIGNPAGYTGAEAQAALMQALKEDRDAFRAQAPILSIVSETAGSIPSPLGKIKWAAKGAKGAKTIWSMGRPALEGAIEGGISASGSANPGERLDDVGWGMVSGGVIGGGVPVVKQYGGEALRAGKRGLNNATGRAVFDDEKMALRSIGQAMEKNELTRDSIRQAGVDWRWSASPEPSFLDLLPDNKQAAVTDLVRGAAERGDVARERAISRTAEIAKDLSPTVTDRVALLPDMVDPNGVAVRPQVVEDLTKSGTTGITFLKKLGTYQSPGLALNARVGETPADEFRTALGNIHRQAETSKLFAPDALASRPRTRFGPTEGEDAFLIGLYDRPFTLSQLPSQSQPGLLSATLGGIPEALLNQLFGTPDSNRDTVTMLKSLGTREK